MARSLGQAKRGRNKEALRLTVASLAATVTNPGGTFTPTVTVQGPERDAESLTYDKPIPKGSVILDHALTATKTATNVRELVRLAMIDAVESGAIAEGSVVLHREHFAFDPIKGEAGYTARGYKAPANPPEAPEGDSWALCPKVTK